jgi:hypothetical protein
MSLALVLILAASLAPIWLKPSLRRPPGPELEMGTLWEALLAIRRAPAEVTLAETLWDLRDNWIVVGILLAMGFGAGDLICQAVQQANRPKWPQGPAG